MSAGDGFGLQRCWIKIFSIGASETVFQSSLWEDSDTGLEGKSVIGVPDTAQHQLHAAPIEAQSRRIACPCRSNAKASICCSGRACI